MITTVKKDIDLIETKKIQLISIIAQVHNIDLLDAIENLIINSKDDWWTTISKSEQDAIDEGLNDIKSGNLLSHQQVLKEINKRYKDL
jgi:predicted transcriptional regulator